MEKGERTKDEAEYMTMRYEKYNLLCRGRDSMEARIKGDAALRRRPSVATDEAVGPAPTRTWWPRMEQRPIANLAMVPTVLKREDNSIFLVLL